jgi:tetratricopeptide (TPR) repeat protein
VTKAPRELLSADQAATRLAVLPFESFGQEQANDFSEKVVTELTKELTQFARTQRSFSVVSPTEMRKENAATLVLKGSVIQDGDRLIVTANLADPQKQFVLNATDVEGSTEQLPSVLRSLTKKVAEMLPVYVAEAPGARELYLRGRGYLERYDQMENLKNAIAAFETALSQDGAHVLAHAGRAEAYLRKYWLAKDEASLDRARESVMAAMRLNDLLAPVNFAMGLYRVATGDREGAVESFQRSLTIEEGPDATRELANSYDALNRLELAEATYRRAIQLRKGYWLGYKDLGVFYQKHGRLEEALPFFKLVAQLAPDDHTSYTNLGAMYLKLQMYSQAVAVYQKAMEIDPGPVAYHALGTAFYLGHQYREAVDLYKKAVELNPTEGAYWGALGDAYRLVPGMVDYAVDAYQQAVLLKEGELRIRPGDARLRADIASWLTLTNRRRALHEIQQALRLSPRGARVQATAASVYEQIGERDQAIAAVGKAVKLGFAVAELQNWPPLEKLRLDPRYKRILATSIEGGN